MPILYKGKIAYTLEEARNMAKLENHERAKTIPARLKEMRIQKGKNIIPIPSSPSMPYTNNPIQDVQEWFDNYLDIQYEKTKNAFSQDLTNI